MDPDYIPQAGLYIRLKRFIKAKKEESSEETESPNQYPKLQINETGDEIKNFYENLTSEEPQPGTSKNFKNSPKKSIPKPKLIPFNKLMFFKMCTNNDVNGLKTFEFKNDEIDSRDEFGWTGLMMAVCENSQETVMFLLDKGAKTDICDKKGNSAISLAKQKNFKNLVDLLDNDSSSEDEKEFVESLKKTYKFYCEECKKEIQESRKSHFTSIVHQFNQKTKERPYRFQIPSENRGLKLMVKQGWDQQSGLGPTNSGHLFPIKTTIRKPRSGVGIKQSPAKVTHFKPFDLNAVKYKEIPKAKNRNEMAREKRRDRRLDQRLRKELS